MLSELGEDIRTYENNYLDFLKWKNEGPKRAKMNKGVGLSKVERILFNILYYILCPSEPWTISLFLFNINIQRLSTCNRKVR
jgi:hypothetical protein